jgi:hypothetical protein
VTQQEWQTVLTSCSRSWAERKFRVFVLACCRRIAHLSTDRRHHAVLKFVEQLAETGKRTGRTKTARGALAVEQKLTFERPHIPVEKRTAALVAECVAHAFCRALDPDPFRAAVDAARAAAAAVGWERELQAGNVTGAAAPTTFKADEERFQVNLVLEIGGDPVQQATIESGWLRWNHGTIPSIAQSIYEEEAWDRLGILADALEDAGCTDAAILSHCRQPGFHVRGCWVVDLLLGKS